MNRSSLSARLTDEVLKSEPPEPRLTAPTPESEQGGE